MIVAAVAWREVRRAWSSGGLWLPVGFFLLVAVLFPFAVGPDAALLARVRSMLRIKALHDTVQDQARELATWNQRLEQRVVLHRILEHQREEALLGGAQSGEIVGDGIPIGKLGLWRGHALMLP